MTTQPQLNQRVSEDLDLRELKLEDLALNQATTRSRWSHKDSLEGYARHGIGQVTLWRDKIKELGVCPTRTLLKDLGLDVTGINRIGPVFSEDGTLFPDFLEDAKRGIEDARELDADNLMFFPGTSLPGKTDLQRARQLVNDQLAEILPFARQADVELVIEPLHPMVAGDRSCINTMKQANDICDVLGSGIGIVVDVYHVWWDAELQSEIDRAGASRLSGFHINDWLVPTTDMLTDRGMIGDGVIELRKIRSWMEEAGYRGPVEIEIFSEYWWQQDPDLVVETAIKRALQLA